jgi:hypothetical protein
MKKCLLIRSLLGFVIGAAAVHLFTLAIGYFAYGQWTLCAPGLIDALGETGAIALQTALGALFGMIALGGMCVYDIETWSLLRASLVHCLLVLVSYLIVGLILRWFSADAASILIVSGIILAVYAVIWLCMYIAWKREMRKMNALTEAYRKERSETDT